MPFSPRGRTGLGPRLVAPILVLGFALIASLAATVNPVIFPIGVIILMPLAVLIGLTL